MSYMVSVVRHFLPAFGRDLHRSQISNIRIKKLSCFIAFIVKINLTVLRVKIVELVSSKGEF